MVQIEFSNVKNWLQFLISLERFLNLPQVKSALGGNQIELQPEMHATVRFRIMQVTGIGDYEVWEITCDGNPIGRVSAFYLDEHFFILSSFPFGNLEILSEEEKQLLTSSGHWATPVSSINLSLSAKDEETVQFFLEIFKSLYVDTYPNAIAERYAPLVEVIH